MTTKPEPREQCEQIVVARFSGRLHEWRCCRDAVDYFRGHFYCRQHYNKAVANRQDWDVPITAW